MLMVLKMIDDGKSYSEIIQQISAVKGDLDSVVEVIVQDLVEHYVSQAAVDTTRNGA
jgi:DNA-binding FrmR family transcriptional regulator